MNRRHFVAGSLQLGSGLLAAGPLLTLAPGAGAAAAKSRVFVTGSADGLGYAAAKTLLAQGHYVAVHVRSKARLPAVQTLLDQGAAATVGDLADPVQIRDLAAQVNALGRMDAVIHNAGISSGTPMLMVNTVAPYLLTALIQRPRRLIYLSSAMHKSGNARLQGMDWTGRSSTGSYSDSKLFVTVLMAAVARRWAEVYSNAVNPGWVPTRMGGPGAPDDLRLGHLTQEWLAVSHDPKALTSGGYWHHQALQEPHPAVRDVKFQDLLLAELARATGVTLA
jgi:NAD(P)-dependent dehydrogenase (short-subunit alcohol dehydrogenase family)